MIKSSNTNMRTALEAALDHLSNKPDSPVELICQIYNALAPVDFGEDPRVNFRLWLLCGGKYQVKSISDAEKMFCIGYNFAQEQVAHEVGV